MMEGFGCTVTGRLALGAREGYPFSAEMLSGGEPPEFEFRFAVAGDAKPAATALGKLGQDYVRWRAEAEEDAGVLVAYFTPPSDFYVQNGIFTLLKNAVPRLQAAGLAPPEACPLCGLAGCDGYAYLDPVYRPVHLACLDTRLDLPEADVIPPRRSYGNVALGILGALVGAIVAALPIWSLALSRDRVYFILYAFIPILSGLLYRTFRGRANPNVAGLAVLGSSLLAAMALELVWYWLVLSAGYGITVPFWESAGMYFATHTFFQSIREMLSCLIALMVGFVGSTIFLRRYAQEKTAPPRPVRGAVFVRGTARPMAEAAQNEAAETES